MLVTIVVVVKADRSIPTLTNKFMKRIDDCGFKKENMEVVFALLGSETEGMRAIRSKPIIRVVQIKSTSIGDAMAFCMENCHGDFFIMANLTTTFKAGKIESYGQSFSNVPRLAFIIDGGGVMAMRRLKIKFPGDLFDFKTYVILYAIINHYNIMGSWGRLHKKEVQRFYYKFDKISWMDKIRILMKVGLK